MAALVSLSQAKRHLSIAQDDTSSDTDINLKVGQASDIILSYVSGRRILVTSITSTGGVALVTTPTPHGLTTNDVVTIWGWDQPQYNGTITATVLTTTTFTYPVTGSPASPATGGLVISAAATWTDATVPPRVQSAVLLMLGSLWVHRGDDMGGASDGDAATWQAIERILVRERDPALA